MKVEKDVDDEILKLIKRSKSEQEIKRYYKKPSNRKKIEDDLIEKKIIGYLEQFANIKDVEVKTKQLRERQNANK